MTLYAPRLPNSAAPLRSWRRTAETNASQTLETFTTLLQKAKGDDMPITLGLVAAFAAVHLRTETGIPIQPAAHHWLWLRLMCDPYISHLLIVGTPDSAKTTWALAYAACHIGFYPERPIIIAAVSGSVAEKRSIALRNIIESPQFAATFPTVKPAAGMPWTATQWSVAENGTPHSGRIHPTVSSYGTGGSITGGRAALLIADDILDFDNTRTQYQRKTVDEWFHVSLLSRLMAQTGRAIVIGNAHHHDDTIARLRQSEAWATCHIPLLTEGPQSLAYLSYPNDYAGTPIGSAVGAAEVEQ